MPPIAHTMNALPEAPPPHGHERTMSVEDVLLFAGPWIVGMTVAIAVPHIALHGVGRPTGASAVLTSVLTLLLAYGVSVVIHELLHVVGMLVFGRVPVRSVSWGHRIREGVVYVHTSQPMSVRAYRGVLVLPGILTGILPVVAGWATGSLWLTAYGWLMTTSAVGDLAILRLIRDLPSSTLVLDHPAKVGVIVRDTQEDERRRGEHA